MYKIKDLTTLYSIYYILFTILFCVKSFSTQVHNYDKYTTNDLNQNISTLLQNPPYIKNLTFLSNRYALKNVTIKTNNIPNVAAEENQNLLNKKKNYNPYNNRSSDLIGKLNHLKKLIQFKNRHNQLSSHYTYPNHSVQLQQQSQNGNLLLSNPSNFNSIHKEWSESNNHINLPKNCSSPSHLKCSTLIEILNKTNLTSLIKQQQKSPYFDPIGDLLAKSLRETCISLEQLCDLKADCEGGVDENLHSLICGKLPLGSYCNFEDGWCGWENEEITDKLQWERRTGPYYDEYTGPDFDHTFKNSSGHFIYVAGATPHKLGDTAKIRSPIFQLPTGLSESQENFIKRNCKLRYWYHMYGPHTGLLKAHVISEQTNLLNFPWMTPSFSHYNSRHANRIVGLNHQVSNSAASTLNQIIWRVFAQNQNYWRRVDVTIFENVSYPLPSNFYLEFVAKMHYLTKGDVALDDISLSRECFGIDFENKSHIDEKPSIDRLDNTTRMFKDLVEVISSKLVNATLPLKSQWAFSNEIAMNSNGSTLFKKDDIFYSKYKKLANIPLFSWISPADNYYTFNVSGARGGMGVYNNITYGVGTSISAKIYLPKNEIIFILVGQPGQNACQPILYDSLNKNGQSMCNSRANLQKQNFYIQDYYQRRKISGGAGGGGGASYIFKFDKNSSTLIPLIIAGGGGGASAIYSSASEMSWEQAHGKTLDKTRFNLTIPDNGFTNIVGAGGGGGWNHGLARKLGHITYTNGMSGGDFMADLGFGGQASLCGPLVFKQQTQEMNKNYKEHIWPTNGGTGGGGAPCNSGGAGGGFRGGDASNLDSPYQNGQGGFSYVDPNLVINPVSFVRLESQNTGPSIDSMVQIEPTIKACPCSHGCNIVDAYKDLFYCNCPKGMRLSGDNSIDCINAEAIKQPTFAKQYIAVICVVGIITITLLTCILIIALNQTVRRKIFKSPFGRNVDANASINDFLDANSNGTGPSFDYLKGNRAFWEALNHELQLDKLRNLSNKFMPSTILLKRIFELKDKVLSSNNSDGITTKMNSTATTTLFGDTSSMGQKNLAMPEINIVYNNINPLTTNLDGTLSSTIYNVPNSISHLGDKTSSVSNTDIDILQMTPVSTEFYDELEYDLIEIPRNKLKLTQALGEGAFGEVYKGLLLYPKALKTCMDINKKTLAVKLFREAIAKDYEKIDVAIKTLPDNRDPNIEIEFLKEAIIMSKFNHPNIVKMYGVCLSTHPKFIVLEYLSGGDLKNFLKDIRTKKKSSFTILELIQLALDIAEGAWYLEQNHFVHRDMAARNCLVGYNNDKRRIAKIADFGMSRDVYRANYYRKSGKAMLPVKWMPPEAFLDGVFTAQTDIWSYGILLWEIFTLGMVPYPGLTNQEVMCLVAKGERLSIPQQCPTRIKHLIHVCWDCDPCKRPSFDNIRKFLKDCIEKSNTHELHKVFKFSGINDIPLVKNNEEKLETQNFDLKRILPNARITNSPGTSYSFNEKGHLASTSSDFLVTNEEPDTNMHTNQFFENPLAFISRGGSHRDTNASKNSQSTSGIGGSMSCCSNTEEDVVFYPGDNQGHMLNVPISARKAFQTIKANDPFDSSDYRYLSMKSSLQDNGNHNTYENTNIYNTYQNVNKNLPNDAYYHLPQSVKPIIKSKDDLVVDRRINNSVFQLNKNKTESRLLPEDFLNVTLKEFDHGPEHKKFNSNLLDGSISHHAPPSNLISNLKRVLSVPNQELSQIVNQDDVISDVKGEKSDQILGNKKIGTSLILLPSPLKTAQNLSSLWDLEKQLPIRQKTRSGNLYHKNPLSSYHTLERDFSGKKHPLNFYNSKIVSNDKQGSLYDAPKSFDTNLGRNKKLLKSRSFNHQYHNRISNNGKIIPPMFHRKYS